MKKINLLILTILFALPFAVKAATTPKVLTVKATIDGITIEYEGTTEEGVYAVMCKLYDDEGEVDLLSTSVDSQKFSGKFTAPKKGEYKVYCANYDGGEIKSADVAVEENKNNPDTYDSGITTYIILIVVAITGIAGVLIYKNKKNKNK